MTGVSFPQLAARDLDGREVALPAALPAERNVVLNVQTARLTGPYRWYRAIGPRLSLADHGLAFGTTTARGVCLLFWEPVRGIGPFGVIRHPGLTLTVADPQRFAATVRHHAGLPAAGTASA